MGTLQNNIEYTKSFNEEVAVLPADEAEHWRSVNSFLDDLYNEIQEETQQRLQNKEAVDRFLMPPPKTNIVWRAKPRKQDGVRNITPYRVPKPFRRSLKCLLKK